MNISNKLSTEIPEAEEKLLTKEENIDIEIKLDKKEESVRKTNIKNKITQIEVSNNVIIKEILLGSSTHIVTSLCMTLVQALNLMFVGKNDDTSTDMRSVQLAFIMLFIFGKDFSSGAVSSFKDLGNKAYINKDYDLFYKIYNKSRIFITLTFILLILPLNFPSDYLLYFLGIDSVLIDKVSTLLRFILLPELLNEMSKVNIAFLGIIGLDYIGMISSLFYLIIHLFANIALVYSLKLGIYGVGISIIISELSLFIISMYFIIVNNPCGKDVIYIDTSSVSSSKFYLFFKEAYEVGLVYSISHLPFLMACFLSYYLDSESFDSNIIFLSYISIAYELILGFCNFFNIYMINNLHLKMSNIIYSFKVTTISILTVTVIISILNYSFRNSICYLYVFGDNIQCNNVSYLIKLYTFFLFFDYGFNITRNMLRIINIYSSIQVYFSVMSLIIFLPLGLIFSFSFKLGYTGFWYSLFISMILFSLINFFFIRTLNIETEIKNTIKKLALVLEEEALN